MGLGIETRASLKKKGLLFSSKIQPKELAAAILAGTIGTPLEAVGSIEELEPGEQYAIRLHPAAEPIFLSVESSEIAVRAKTSTVGPGYHAFVVRCLDAAEKALGLAWQWDKDSDETGYLPDRNFELLQAQMAFFLNHLARALLERVEAEGATGMQIFMPLDFGAAPRDGEIFTPLGPITVETLQTWATEDVGRQIANAADFMPWWDDGFGGRFYRGLGLNYLWMECRWGPPLDDQERRAMERALTWCAEAEKLRAPLPVPESAFAELREIAASEVPRPFGKREGIGYRRRLTKHQLSDNWSLTLPGGMKRSVEYNNGATLLFMTHLLQIRVSISSGPRRAGDFRVPPGTFQLDSRIADTKADPDHFGKSYMLKTSPTAETDEVCLITFSGAKIMRELAESLFDGLQYTPPDSQGEA